MLPTGPGQKTFGDWPIPGILRPFSRLKTCGKPVGRALKQLSFLGDNRGRFGASTSPLEASMNNRGQLALIRQVLHTNPGFIHIPPDAVSVYKEAIYDKLNPCCPPGTRPLKISKD